MQQEPSQDAQLGCSKCRFSRQGCGRCRVDAKVALLACLSDNLFEQASRCCLG